MTCIAVAGSTLVAASARADEWDEATKRGQPQPQQAPPTDAWQTAQEREGQKPKEKEAPRAPGSLPPTSDAGVSLGARIGYGLPINYGTGTNGKFAPVWLDVGYRVSPHWYFGGYFQYGIWIVDCPPTRASSGATIVSCSGNSIRAGALVHYRFRPEESFDPWFGWGLGFARDGATANVSGPCAPFCGNTSGSEPNFELVDVEIGADFRPGGTTRVGPFVAATAAIPYGRGWVTLGARFAFEP